MTLMDRNERRNPWKEWRERNKVTFHDRMEIALAEDRLKDDANSVNRFLEPLGFHLSVRLKKDVGGRGEGFTADDFYEHLCFDKESRCFFPLGRFGIKSAKEFCERPGFLTDCVKDLESRSPGNELFIERIRFLSAALSEAVEDKKIVFSGNSLAEDKRLGVKLGKILRTKKEVCDFMDYAFDVYRKRRSVGFDKLKDAGIDPSKDKDLLLLNDASSRMVLFINNFRDSKDFTYHESLTWVGHVANRYADVVGDVCKLAGEFVKEREQDKERKENFSNLSFGSKEDVLGFMSYAGRRLADLGVSEKDDEKARFGLVLEKYAQRLGDSAFQKEDCEYVLGQCMVHMPRFAKLMDGMHESFDRVRSFEKENKVEVDLSAVFDRREGRGRSSLQK